MSKKFLTKLLNEDFRRRVINSISPKKIQDYKILQYARYTVDKIIIGRNMEHESDREWAYGFSPLEVLAYMDKGGKLVTKLFEFNTVNHFLREKNGDAAVEVVTAILVDWVKADKNIRDFDIDEIDAGLKKIEDEYMEQQKILEKTEEAGRLIKEKTEAIINGMSGISYEAAVDRTSNEIRPILENMVSDGTLKAYEIGYERNVQATQAAGLFLLDIRYLVEDGEWMTLRCDVKPPVKSLSSEAGA